MIPATAFYLSRHGESEANQAGIAAGGGVDSPLTSKGEEQARDLANIIDCLAIKPSVIFASPMKRALRTAEIVNTHLRLPLHIVEGLEEHHIGDWEGQPWSKIGPRMIAGEIPPNGENYEQYDARVQRVLTPLLSQPYETPPLIVAHGGTFHSLWRLYGLESHTVKNCHLHRLEPLALNPAFPWKVLEYNVGGIELREIHSQHCPNFKK